MQSNSSSRCSADQVIRLANRLTFGDGPQTGKPVVLRPFQESIFRKVCDSEMEIAAIWMPKKNSKTFLAAIFILTHLLHGLRMNLSPEIYSGSGTGINQAALVFRAVAGFIYQSPALQQILWVRENIYKIESRDKTRPGMYKCVVADDDKLDGPNPSMFVLDEIHRGGKKTEAIWDTMLNGMAQRPDPLAISISTAGVYDPESAAWRLYDRSKKIDQGIYQANGLLPIIYEHDVEHDGPVPWDDGENAVYEAYVKVNPGAGDFIQESKIRSTISTAIDLPSKRSNFERFFLGI